MGMSASQARFLGLTARKNNVEYEGQQVNQQRTVLGNETANYYNDLLGMSVPVPPSPNDYTKTIYTFEDGALTNTITSMIAQQNGKFKISYMMNWTDDFAAVSAGTSLVTKNYTGTGTPAATDYMVGARRFRELGADLIEDDEYYKTIKDSPDKVQQLKDEETNQYAYKDILDKQYGSATWLVRYVKNTTSNEWEPIFVKKEVLDAAIYDENKTSLTYIPMYTIGSAKKIEEIKQVEARFEQDATGRIINVTLNPDSEDRVTYAVTTSTVTDQAKYDDAMNQYEYDKALYDKAIQETNAKIEIIQVEDKNLELRLKQLDTEQEAIQTEMDAVQKVIEKNTESSFKTFG